MIALFTKILFCLTLAAGLGGLIGWLLRGAGIGRRLADAESKWRLRLDTAEKERLAISTERDRVVKENASLKSLHAACGPRIAELETEIETVRARNQPDAGAAAVADKELERIAELERELEQRDKRLAAFELQITELEGKLAENELQEVDLELPQLDEVGLPAPSGDQPSVTATEDGGDSPDDLKKIKGVGPVLERKLNTLGISRFRQIASWSTGDVQQVAKDLGAFRDRIERDDWVSQAARLHKEKYGENA